MQEIFIIYPFYSVKLYKLSSINRYIFCDNFFILNVAQIEILKETHYYHIYNVEKYIYR